jgi:hypothetical protein
MNHMRLLTALEIATNQPNGDILITAMQHKETLKWASFMYLMRDGNIHKLMLSYDIGENGFEGFDTEEIAKQKMEDLVQVAIEACREKGYNV